MNYIKIQQDILKYLGKNEKVYIEPKENHYWVTFNKISFFRIYRSNFLLNDLFCETIKLTKLIYDEYYFYTVDELRPILINNEILYLIIDKKTESRYCINWNYFRKYGIKIEDYSWYISEKGVLVGKNEEDEIMCGCLCIRRY